LIVVKKRTRTLKFLSRNLESARGVLLTAEAKGLELVELVLVAEENNRVERMGDQLENQTKQEMSESKKYESTQWTRGSKKKLKEQLDSHSHTTT
jgi:hypothetical protein